LAGAERVAISVATMQYLINRSFICISGWNPDRIGVWFLRGKDAEAGSYSSCSKVENGQKHALLFILTKQLMTWRIEIFWIRHFSICTYAGSAVTALLLRQSLIIGLMEDFTADLPRSFKISELLLPSACVFIREVFTCNTSDGMHYPCFR